MPEVCEEKTAVHARGQWSMRVSYNGLVGLLDYNTRRGRMGWSPVDEVMCK
jgi:hypothetical protein